MFSSILLILIPFVSYGAKYIFNIQLAHILKIEVFGDFMLALKTFSIVSAFTLLGTAASAKRFLSLYLKTHNTPSAVHYIHWNLRLVSRCSLILITALATLCLTMIALHVFNLKYIATYHITFYLLFLAPLGALAILIASYLQCNDNTIAANIFTQIGQYGVYAVLLCVTPYFYEGQYTNKTLWIISLSVLTILNFCELLVFAYYFPRSFLKEILTLPKYPAVKVQGDWQKTSRHLILNQLMYLLVCAIDIYAVQFFASSADAVGQYSAILTITSIVWLLSYSIYSPLTAKVSHLISTEPASLQSLINRQNLNNLVMTTMMTLGIIIWGKFLLNSFGPHYATSASYSALVIATLGCYLGSFLQPATTLLSYSGNAIYLVYGSTLELVVITLSAIILTYVYGIIGAAAASSLTLVVKIVYYLAVTRKTVAIKPLSFV